MESEYSDADSDIIEETQNQKVENKQEGKKEGAKNKEQVQKKREKGGFSLAEALDIAYNGDLDMDIFIEPPEANVETDEDSADGDDGGLVDNLTSRQLRAAAEIKLPNNDRIGVEYTQNEISDAQDSEGLESTFASVLLDEKEKYWLKERRNKNQISNLRGS
ncbi:hypothetical protein JTB14_020644 [Gonioctena quinquepunctata]|nr:hypothetical protein JTB14_020644 [Gonioctena quinquepunctata]